MNQEKKKYKKISSSISITTIISLTMVLFLVGLISLVALLSKDLADHARQNITFSVVLKDQLNGAPVSNEQIKRIEKLIKSSQYVNSTQLVTKEEALKTLSASLGDDLGYLDQNPLLASIEVKLNSQFANEENIQDIIKTFKQYNEVKEVIYQKDLLKAVNENIHTLTLILLGIAVLLLILSSALINNTIRLGVHSQRFLIRTMQLVGANESFIRRPFVRENVIMGLIASLLAITAIWGLLYSLKDLINPIFDLANIDKISLVCLSILLMGVIITFLSSWRSVNHYLHLKQKELHR